MKKVKANGVFYSLNIADIQSVAFQELKRDLSFEEIKRLTDRIPKKINWYEAIADSIRQTIRQ